MRQSQQPLAEPGAVPKVSKAAARGAGTVKASSRAVGGCGKAVSRGEPAEVSGEDGQLRWAIGARVEQQGQGTADPEEAVRVGQGGDDGSSKQLVPVWRDDCDGYDEDAAGTISDRLGHGRTQHHRRGERVDDLAVGLATHGARAGGPVRTDSASTASEPGSGNSLQ